MAFIQVDPEQKNATIALLSVLALAIGFMVWRLMPQDSSSTSATQQAQAASTSAPVRVSAVMDYNPARNPFEKPPGLRSSLVADPLSESGSSSGIRQVDISRPPGAWNDGGGSKLDSGSVAPIGVPGFDSVQWKAEGATDSAKTEQKKPTFTLLATVKSGNGYSAVIRSGDSTVRVVEVGDVLGEGFRVKKLDAGRAVLTDGRETIIARRPQS